MRGAESRPTIAFASPYCLIDGSSGAAIATQEWLHLLAAAGMRCQAYCSALLDFDEEVCLEQSLAHLCLPYDVRKEAVAGASVRMLSTRLGDLPVTIFRNQFTRLGPLPQEQPAFLALYERFLDADPPDVALTYGGDPLARAMRELTRRRKIPVVFALHNFAYHDAGCFTHVDYVAVPSQFSKDYYRKHLGLDCHVLPNVIDPRRAMAADRQPQYLTFVNPQATKGLFVLARIFHELARRRPDIPILIVDSRGRGKVLEQTGLDLSWVKNLFTMANTTDPRKFYRVTKVLLMPSLWNESFGLVAAEAMTNGIPVLASNRGALPEVVGEGGLLFDIPARYTPDSTDVPSAEEVTPWVEAILRLWDDEAFYRQQSEKARRQAERWQPERLRPLYAGFFGNLRPQPGLPIVQICNGPVSAEDGSLVVPPLGGSLNRIPAKAGTPTWAAEAVPLVVPPLGGSFNQIPAKAGTPASATSSRAPISRSLRPSTTA